MGNCSLERKNLDEIFPVPQTESDWRLLETQQNLVYKTIFFLHTSCSSDKLHFLMNTRIDEVNYIESHCG